MVIIVWTERLILHKTSYPLLIVEMLYFWRLRFRHPYSGRQIKFEARIPADFNEIMIKLGSPAK
jgi:hypothetical protein